MTREKFLEELDYLLQDIPDEEKQDALQYYTDYFEEAGSDKEAEIIKELGSPERIASIIRTELSGGRSDSGEFTDTGYRDQTFEEPHYHVSKTVENTDSSAAQPEKKPFRTSRTLKIILGIVLFLVALPFLIPVGGGILGIFFVVIILLLGAFLLLGILTFAAMVCGIVLIPVGVVTLFSSPITGVLVAGTGMASLGAGFLLLALCVAFYGKLIPFVFCNLIECLSKFFHRRDHV